MAWYWYVVIAIALYIIVCFVDMGIKASSMKAGLQDEKYGEARYEELKKKGIQTDYKIYTEEEIAKDPTKDSVRLVFMPLDSGAKTKYMLVCPGGGYLNLSMVGEGYCIGAKVNEKGFSAFVLEYRVGENCSYHAPEKDVARAILFINENAELFNVETEGYSLCGFSAGANLVGLFGTEDYGYKNFDGISKPSAIIMGYPWCNPNARKIWNAMQLAVIKALNKKGCAAFLSDDLSEKSLDTMRVHLHITENYPATYIMQGDQDILVPKNTHADVLVKALREKGVMYEYEVYRKVNHGCGLCVGGEAEGWFDNAVEFWKENI